MELDKFLKMTAKTKVYYQGKKLNRDHSSLKNLTR